MPLHCMHACAHPMHHMAYGLCGPVGMCKTMLHWPCCDQACHDTMALLIAVLFTHMLACRMCTKSRCLLPETQCACAAEFSDCRSRLRGGAAGWIKKGQTAPMFEEAVFEASIGELVRAETHHGLHLIRVEAERQDLLQSLVQV